MQARTQVMTYWVNKSLRALLTLILLLAIQNAFAGPTDITILNNDAVNEGFNDTTDTSTVPARNAYAPPLPSIADNPGATLGAMRLNVFQAAADFWETQLDITVEIVVSAQMNPLSCSASSATLGSAGANSFFRDFTGAPRVGTFYAAALTNQLFGAQANGSHEINATFNSAIDNNASCLSNLDWWYGIDEATPSGTISLFEVVLHEIGHGLGFADAVGSNGSKLAGFDDAYMVQLRDFASNIQWPDMTDLERSNSAGNAQVSGTSNSQGQVWTGKNVRDISAGVFENTKLSPAAVRQGGCMDVYAPTSFAGGSSISHFDTGTRTIATPQVSELMEPFATPEPTLVGTLAVLADIGWNLSAAGAATISAASPGYTESTPHITGMSGDTTCSTVETLSVVIASASVSEADGSAATTATVSRNSNTASALSVTLSSDDTSEATVPTTVTIVAGQSSTTFDIDAIDDVLVDGTQTATITASAAAHNSGSDTLDITDNDTAMLSIIIAVASVSEGAGADATTATVSRNTSTSEALSVTLSSNDTSEATVPASVTIPTGQDSLTFNIDAVDDASVDGTQTVTITASAAAHISASDTLDVLDDDSTLNPDLVVESPNVSDTTLTTGQVFSASVTVRNQGTGASTNTILRYVRSTDSVISTTDIEIGTDSVAVLAAGTTSAESELVSISTAGTFWIGACVDNVVGEVVVNNQCSSGIQVAVSDGLMPDIFEPDDTQETANVINNNATQTHNLHIAGDEDWLSFNVSTPITDFIAETNGALAGDTTLSIFDSSNQQIAFNDDKEAGVDLYSRVELVSLPAGQYFILINEFNATSTLASYTISLNYTQAIEDDDILLFIPAIIGAAVNRQGK